jgi:hypothetical protein
MVFCEFWGWKYVKSVKHGFEFINKLAVVSGRGERLKVN